MLLDAPFGASRARRYWVDPAQYPVAPDAIQAAADGARDRIVARQAELGLDAGRTMVIGFSQGASVALELAFGEPGCAGLVIAYAARLYRLPTVDDRVTARVRLVHGGGDSVVPAAYGEAAFRRLRGIGADVSLDLLPEEGHAVGQVQINRGTSHAMDWVFDRPTRLQR
jgi:predicted esterase